MQFVNTYSLVPPQPPGFPLQSQSKENSLLQFGHFATFQIKVKNHHSMINGTF